MFSKNRKSEHTQEEHSSAAPYLQNTLDVMNFSLLTRLWPEAAFVEHSYCFSEGPQHLPRCALCDELQLVYSDQKCLTQVTVFAKWSRLNRKIASKWLCPKPWNKKLVTLGSGDKNLEIPRYFNIYAGRPPGEVKLDNLFVRFFSFVWWQRSRFEFFSWKWN